MIVLAGIMPMCMPWTGQQPHTMHLQRLHCWPLIPIVLFRSAHFQNPVNHAAHAVHDHEGNSWSAGGMNVLTP